MFRTIAIFVAFFSFVFFTIAKPTPDFTLAREVLKSGIRDQAFPGCSVCVGTDEGILWSEGCGRFDYEHHSPVTRRTIYDLASCTKVTGTTSVYMRLVAQRKVNVSDPVGNYLPEFIAAAATDDERAKRSKMTIENLLTHTAGLTAWKPFYKSVNSYRELLNGIYNTPLENEPGTKFRYSDCGMILAGEIASRIAGKPLAELEQELVFQPLNMRNTLRNPPKKLLFRIPPTEKWPDKDGFVRGVVHDENARAGEGITGHAGLFATAEDLGALCAELLRALDGRSKLFPKEVVTDFFHERSIAKGSERGLGWIVSSRTNDNGHVEPVISHTGFTGTSIRMYPERKLYIVLLTNRVHPTRDNNKIEKVRRNFADAIVRARD